MKSFFVNASFSRFAFSAALSIAGAAFVPSPSVGMVDDPPTTGVECGGSATITPPPGTLVTGTGATAAEAKANLCVELGFVCFVCAGPACELKLDKSIDGTGGSTIGGGSPGGPYLVTVLYGTGGSCKASCSPCL